MCDIFYSFPLFCFPSLSSSPSPPLFPFSVLSDLICVMTPLGTTKEQEQKRVDKELAHIRKQFGDKCMFALSSHPAPLFSASYTEG